MGPTSARDAGLLAAAFWLALSPEARALEDAEVVSSPEYVVALCQGDNPVTCTTTCGGTLIAPNLVATSRHCADVAAPTALDCATYRFDENVVPASQMWTTAASPVASSARFHQALRWDFPLPTGCGHDLAFLTLADPFEAQEVTPAAPATSHEAGADGTGTVYGYGITGPGAPVDLTRRSRTTNVLCFGGRDSCRAIAGGDTLFSTEVAVDAQVCPGDSGAGLFDASGLLIGDLGRTIGPTNPCAYGVYTRLAPHALLLARVTRAAALAGSYPAPSWAAALEAEGDSPTLAPRVFGGPCDGDADCASGACRSDDRALTWSCVETCDASCAGTCKTVPDDPAAPGGSFCFASTDAPSDGGGCAAAGPSDPASFGFGAVCVAACVLLRVRRPRP